MSDINDKLPHVRIGKKIQSLSFVDGNNLFLMMQDLMYFDTVPAEYKVIIREIFEVEIEFEENQP